MRVLDLFSGLGGWSQAFADRGHEVMTVDSNPVFRPTNIIGVQSFRDLLVNYKRRIGRWDVILASPPCEAFSVMRIGANWDSVDGRLYPKTHAAHRGVALVEATIDIVELVQPMFWVMENPRAALRKLPEVADLERRTVTYCQYGEQRMKPTDLWSDRWDAIPLELRPACKNGDPCHVSAPRGSRTGTQGYGTAADRAKVPYALSEAVCIACEQAQGRPVK